jgi:hypothetical protein
MEVRLDKIVKTKATRILIYRLKMIQNKVLSLYIKILVALVLTILSRRTSMLIRIQSLYRYERINMEVRLDKIVKTKATRILIYRLKMIQNKVQYDQS